MTSLKGIDDEIDKWIAIWVMELTKKAWFSHIELQYDYPRMRILEGQSTFIFPISSSKYTVKVCFFFEKGIALISEVIMDKQL